jgi:hypothetical protein
MLLNVLFQLLELRAKIKKEKEKIKCFSRKERQQLKKKE